MAANVEASTARIGNAAATGTPDDTATAANTKTFPIGTFVLLATLAIVAEVVVILFVLGNVSSSAIAQGALVLALTTAAVGIERLIELGWTAVDLLGGPWWPVVKVTPNISALVDQVNAYLKPFQQTAAKMISDGQQAGTLTKTQADTALAALTDIDSNLQSIRKGVRSDELQVYIGTASARVADLRKSLSKISDVADVADQALAILGGVADSFKENPAKRLISLYAGIILGLIVAATLRMDIFQVTPDSATSTTVATVASQVSALGVIASGFIVGLGSTPTHEVIKLIQGAKDKVKSDASTK